MEAPNKNLGLGFPGYDSCRFPKATRSSRGRGDGGKKPNDLTDNDLPKDMHFFELLATVAGQLLQEQKDEAPQDTAKTEANQNAECIETSPCPLITGQNESENASSDLGIVNPSKCTKASHDTGLLLPNPEALHDQYSAISGLDHLDLSLPYELESNTTMTYSSRRWRRNSEASSRNQKDSANTSSPLEMLIKPETRETSLTCKPGKIAAASPCIHPYGSEVEKHMMSTIPGQHKDISHMLQNSFHDVVDAESPPLLSSGSSEETPCLMDPKYDSTIAIESKRQDLGCHNFLRAKSSALKSPFTKLSDTSFKSQKARSADNGIKQEELGSSGNRKRRRIAKGDKNEKEGKRRSPKARAGRKAVEIPGIDKNGDQSSSRNSVVDHQGDTDMSEKDSEKPDSFSTMSSPRKPTIKKSGDHVQFTIHSFMIPELSVDLPKSATIANLKKAVMDAAMNLLGGGLCVRVLLQGEKLVNESESLIQAGIANGGKLGFMLEPNPMSATSSMEDTFLVLSHGNNQTPLRYPVLPQGSEINTSNRQMCASGGILEIEAQYSSGIDRIQPKSGNPNKPDGMMHDANGMLIPSSSCALILHPTQANNGLNGLAIVPFGQNMVNKRRIRRPFSVAEVELLVEAVEELGTGRWRDVKLHAFPQAKHRTYVDLKDKWKTLVHTASIAPHQRRGETVPQSLLDRVIQAHSHWTAQQSKQHNLDETKLLMV